MANRINKRKRQYDAVTKRGAEDKATSYRAAMITLRADGPNSLDEKNRSVEVVMSSEAPAIIRDWERGIISEVLLMSGAQLPQTKLS